MPLPSETPSVILTLRMIISGKEVGHLIGRSGKTIKSLRKESGARIYINDGSCLEKRYVRDENCPERIITVVGTLENVYQAYCLVCKNMEEREVKKPTRKEGLRLCLVLPSSQCGSLIGKGGKKIKEIREMTSATVSVASEFLPGSTERTVTVGGCYEAVTQCIYHVCCVMIENPVLGTSVEYQPMLEQEKYNTTPRNDNQDIAMSHVFAAMTIAGVLGYFGKDGGEISSNQRQVK